MSFSSGYADESESESALRKKLASETGPSAFLRFLFFFLFLLRSRSCDDTGGIDI